MPAGLSRKKKGNDFRTPDTREQGGLHREGERYLYIPGDRSRLVDAGDVVLDGWHAEPPHRQQNIGSHRVDPVYAGNGGSLGTTTAHLRKMSNVEQLDWVRRYLSPYHGKMKNWLDVYCAVF